MKQRNKKRLGFIVGSLIGAIVVLVLAALLDINLDENEILWEVTFLIPMAIGGFIPLVATSNNKIKALIKLTLGTTISIAIAIGLVVLFGIDSWLIFLFFLIGVEISEEMVSKSEGSLSSEDVMKSETLSKLSPPIKLILGWLSWLLLAILNFVWFEEPDSIITVLIIIGIIIEIGVTIEHTQEIKGVKGKVDAKDGRQ